MGEWIWGAVVLAIVLIVAGGIAWWLAKGCVVTIIGAAGAVIGGLAALMSLVVFFDPDVALTAAAWLTVLSGAWLLGWSLAGGIRGQRLARAEARAEQAIPAPRETARV